MGLRLCLLKVLIYLSCKYPDTSGGSPVTVPFCQHMELGVANGYILDRDISSSSVLNTNTPAKNGRLNYTGRSSWCAATNDSQPYLQFDFEKLYIICAVSTQGNSQGDQWVKKYTLQSSNDGTTWTDYHEAGILKIFPGNFDRNTIVTKHLCSGIVARHLRIIAHDHHDHCCMRIEIFGIPLARENLALEKPTDQSSLYDFQYASIAVNGKKLNIHCTHTRASTKPWWKVDLEQVVPVSEVFILNRGDCCGERLNGAEIRVGNETTEEGAKNSFCAGGLSIPTGTGNFIRCHMTLYGRHLFIRLPGSSKILTLCKVEVYSTVVSRVRSSSTDRFSARTESRQTQREDQGDMDMSKPESVSEVVSTGDGSLHPRLGHDNCSFTAVNQKRHVMAVGRRTATSIRQVER